jgi:hypothetical protein
MFRASFCQSSGAQDWDVFCNIWYTICCKNLSLALLKMGKICPKYVELILEINKTVIVESSWCSILLYHKFVCFYTWYFLRHESKHNREILYQLTRHIFLIFSGNKQYSPFQIRFGGSVETQMSCDRGLLVWRWLHVSAVFGHLQDISCFIINIQINDDHTTVVFWRTHQTSFA